MDYCCATDEVPQILLTRLCLGRPLVAETEAARLTGLLCTDRHFRKPSLPQFGAVPKSRVALAMRRRQTASQEFDESPSNDGDGRHYQLFTVGESAGRD